MGIKDVLPDRPLSFEEFQSLQNQDALDAVYTNDKVGPKDVLILVKEDTEHTLHYTDESGWHITNKNQKG